MINILGWSERTNFKSTRFYLRFYKNKTLLFIKYERTMLSQQFSLLWPYGPHLAQDAPIIIRVTLSPTLKVHHTRCLITTKMYRGLSS